MTKVIFKGYIRENKNCVYTVDNFQKVFYKELLVDPSMKILIDVLNYDRENKQYYINSTVTSNNYDETVISTVFNSFLSRYDWYFSKK